MIEEEEHAEEEDAEDVTSSGMAEAIQSVQSESPSLAHQLGEMGMTPEKLAAAHHRVTGEGQEEGQSKPD
jgi:hypothetical protein